MSTQPALGTRPGFRPSTVIERVLWVWTEHSARLFLAMAWAAGAVLLFLRIDQGWMHHDDGSLAQSAQRVLAGELPHRDFAELYTGGLAFLDASVFWLLGEDVLWLRVPLFLLFLIYVPCFYVIVRRLASPPVAFAATLFAITWSVPAYSAPMPSWYLLFFSVFGMFAVIRYFDEGRLRWLLVAGGFGGLSIAFKIVGIWFVVAVLLALALAQGTKPGLAVEYRVRLRHRVVVIALATVSFTLALAVLTKKLDLAAFSGLLVPVGAVCCAAAVLGLRGDVGVGSQPVRNFARSAAVFLGGVLVPVAAILVPYLVTGSVGALIQGVLIAPQTRFEHAYHGLPGPEMYLWALPVVVYYAARPLVPPRIRRMADACAGAIAAAVVVGLMLVAKETAGYTVVWQNARALGPLAMVAGAIVLARGRVSADGTRDVVALLLLVAGFMTLVQFPFAAPIYYLYVAPLLLLAAVGVLAYSGGSRLLPAVLLVTLVVFGVRFVDTQSFWTLGVGYRADEHTEVLDRGRASVRIIPTDANHYRRVLALLRAHSKGPFVYAGPDAPEIYFLADKRNPTRSILDFLDSTDSARGSRLLTRLRAHGVGAIVINRNPLQSSRLELRTLRQLRSLYPSGVRIGRFEVRWRDMSRPWVVPSGPWRDLTTSDPAADVAWTNLRSRYIERIERAALAFSPR